VAGVAGRGQGLIYGAHDLAGRPIRLLSGESVLCYTRPPWYFNLLHHNSVVTQKRVMVSNLDCQTIQDRGVGLWCVPLQRPLTPEQQPHHAPPHTTFCLRSAASCTQLREQV
jgi:hypothetical protein